MSNLEKIKKQQYVKKNIPLFLMAAPCMIWLFMFAYAPMFGLVLAFKNYSYRRGILGSEWVGLDNFKYIFSSGDIYRVLGNTILYHVLFTVLLTFFAVMLSLLLYNVRNKAMTKLFQSSITIPHMVSYAMLAYIVYMLLRNDTGFLNNALASLGFDRISWYSEEKYWPYILSIATIWIGAGIKSIYYYASLMSIDKSLFEAAEMDGANKFRQTINVSLPLIAPTICIFLILDLGSLLGSNFALFYSVTLDSSALYKTTDVLSTYLYRGLMSGNISTSTALGLFSSIVTTVMTLMVNGIVKKVSPDNSLL